MVGRRGPLVACGGDDGIAHSRVNVMILAKRSVERDAGAERLHRLIARMRESRRRLKTDPRSLDGEGEVGRMVELQRGGKVQARAVRDDPFAGGMGSGEGGREVNAGASRPRSANGGDGDRL